MATCGEFWLHEAADGDCALFHVDVDLGLSALAEGSREELTVDSHFYLRTHASHRLGIGRGEKRVGFEPVFVENVVGVVRMEEDEFVLLHVGSEGFVLLRTHDDLVVVAEKLALEDLRRVWDPPMAKTRPSSGDSDEQQIVRAPAPSLQHVDVLKWAMKALDRQSEGQGRGAAQARRAFAQASAAASRRACRVDGRRGSVISQLGELAGVRLNGCDRTQRSAYLLMHRLLPELFELDGHAAAFRGDRLADPADPLWSRLRALAAEAGYRGQTDGADEEELHEANRVLKRRNEQLEDALAAALRVGAVPDLPPEARPPAEETPRRPTMPLADDTTRRPTMPPVDDTMRRPTTMPVDDTTRRPTMAPTTQAQPGWSDARAPDDGQRIQSGSPRRHSTDPTLTTFDDLDIEAPPPPRPAGTHGQWKSMNPAPGPEVAAKPAPVPSMADVVVTTRADSLNPPAGPPPGPPRRPRDRTLTTFDDFDDEPGPARTDVPSWDPASPTTGPPGRGPTPRPRGG